MSNTISSNEEWIKTFNGQDLYTKSWSTPGNPIATLVMIHGFGEHIGRYDRLFTAFAGQGIECYGYDQRGFGETGKKSGHFGDNQGYETVLKDVDEAIIKAKRQDVPLVLMGHSMGGGIVLNYVARKDQYKGYKLLTAVIASAPLVTLSMPIPAIKYYPLKGLSKVLPSFTIRAGLDPSGISHDKEEVEIYKNDPLVHDFATLATVSGFLDAGNDILNTEAKKITLPILYSHGDADPINAFKSTKKAYELSSSTDKELKNWNGLYHELHNETMPQRQEVTEFYIQWIKARVQAK